MPLTEHVYCLAFAFKTTEWVEQQICIEFCVKLKHSLNIPQKATDMGNWWLAASSWQCACPCITSHAEFFGKTSNHPGDLAPLKHRFGTVQLLVFPKTKTTFEREEISDRWWGSGKYDGQLMAIGRTLWGPKVPTLKGTEASLSYVRCFLYLLQ